MGKLIFKSGQRGDIGTGKTQEVVRPPAFPISDSLIPQLIVGGRRVEKEVV